MFVSERGTIVSESARLARIRRYYEDLNLPEAWTFTRSAELRHPPDRSRNGLSIRATTSRPRTRLHHLALTCVTSDFRVSTLRRALDGTIKSALAGLEDA
jgi:hypothetical protein